MDRKDSPINELYGTTAPKEPPRTDGSGWLIFLVVLAALFAYESFRPGISLRAHPPRGFLSRKLPSDRAAGRAQEQLARECWDYAKEHLQDAYPFPTPLPQNPRAGLVHSPVIRTECWASLRRVWTRKESWEWSYEWSTDWLTDPQSPFRQTIRRIWVSLWSPA